MLQRFFSYYRPYKKLFLIDFGCAIVAALLELSFPVVVNQVIDKILPQKKLNLIALACFALLTFYLINTLLQYIVVALGHKLGVNIESDMRQDLFQHLQKQSYEYYDNQKTGKLLTRLTSDLFEIAEVAHHGPEDIFITLMTLIGAFLLMLSIHVKLALATFLLVPFIMIALIFFNKKMTGVNTTIFENLAEFNAGIEAQISGIRVTQAFANEAYERKRFNHFNQLYRDAKIKFYQVMGISSAYNYFFIRLINLFSLFFGALYTVRGEISFGQFTAFILLANVFVRPIEKVNTMIESYPKGFAGFKRFTEELDKQPSLSEKVNARTLGPVTGEIDYHHVSFSYPDGPPVLDDVSLHIDAGETIAFVGPSGAGKTTLCNLLPRFYDASSGAVLIDGQDVREASLASLREQIGIVQQDVFLFPGTLKENILYGKLTATDEEVKMAIQRAHLEPVIAQMPLGLATIIGERGVKLSGGQKQRVAIARIFLKNPPILILDEATSALDSQTEKMIQTALASLTEGRTTLIIAHRLGTIKHANKIVVLDQSGIVETGSHQELMANDGTYKKLYRAQFLEE